MSRRDPDARCGTCGVRLARVDRDHEDRCGREAAGWPAFEDDPDETAGRALYRAKADRLASDQANMARRRVKVRDAA